MSISITLALGFAAVRGVMLTAGMVPWARQKLRRADATESERTLLWMVVSRTVLLGLCLWVLVFTERREALAWTLMADLALQLFDAVLAVALRKRAVAVMPAALCVLDGWAALTLMP